MSSIFISGGAAGIGRATALRFLSEGWTVGVYDVNDEALEGLKADHPAIVTGHLDVRDPQSWDTALAAFAEHTGGGIDVLDNNAGVLVAGDLADLTPEQVKFQVDINVLGLTYGAQAAYPYLKRADKGHLVNLCSASAIYGQPGIATYSATKFYVHGLSEALDLEWQEDGIRVVAIWPLWAKTALADVDHGSTKTLGVNITPEQVADKIWEAVHPGVLVVPRIHYSVGRVTTVMANSSKFAPRALVRTINKFIAH
ncbi:SDR family oxidoreductase [Tsukamurella sp. 8F]|uniref:SDR family oxidoreductase n=1 Tax=unclassified Tsukamurella TaxID=2633480 RepID=UPI0023B9A897|nr:MULTISPECIES: SDR family oxidoreductase [unclassified Tsukamurella]MDF0529863.1 SDR family oxidoreductase [Tsukamurella sp. 8J]MDF0587055.1 SDR family oxidoreductase [Tsukamurella sp. 8F]